MSELTLVTKPTDLDLVDESTELSAESKPSSVIVIATMDPPCEVELKVERHDIVIETKKPEIVIGSKEFNICLLYTSPSPRDATLSRMPSSA